MHIFIISDRPTPVKLHAPSSVPTAAHDQQADFSTEMARALLCGLAAYLVLLHHCMPAGLRQIEEAA